MFSLDIVQKLAGSPNASNNDKNNFINVSKPLAYTNWGYLATITYLIINKKKMKNIYICKGPAKRIQHVEVTSSNIIESDMLHSSGHHVALCCMMLDDV